MKYYTMGHTDLMESIERLSEKFGVPFETWDGRDGCLVDNFIGSFNKPGCYPVTIMATEKYLNCWSSCLSVTVARTERDNKKIDNLWNNFIESYDLEYEEVTE